MPKSLAHPLHRYFQGPAPLVGQHAPFSSFLLPTARYVPFDRTLDMVLRMKGPPSSPFRPCRSQCWHTEDCASSATREPSQPRAAALIGASPDPLEPVPVNPARTRGPRPPPSPPDEEERSRPPPARCSETP